MTKILFKKFISVMNFVLYPLAKIYCLIFKPSRIGVKIIIKHGNEILLLKRSYGKKVWTLPGGGISKNESPEEAARREVREEVGINLENISQYGSFRHEGKDIKDFVYVFVTEVQNKSFDLNNYEIEDARWFNIEDLKIKTVEWQTPILKKCFELTGLL